MTPYPNIYGVIPSPATVTVLTGRGTVSEKCTRGIPVVNPSSSIWEKIWAVSEVEFAMKQEGSKFLQVRAIEHVGFPKFDPT